MISHCDSNPAQYERNRRFGHLVHALGRAAGGDPKASSARTETSHCILCACKTVHPPTAGGINDVSKIRSAFLYVTLVQGQHQTLDGNHHQGQKEQDNVNCTVVSAESHAVDIRFSGETERSATETAFVALGNGDSSTQCSDVDDDDDEEEETDVKEGSWITNLPVSPTIVQRQPAFATTNGDVVLPNSDQPTFGNVRVQKSRNVRLVNQTCYNSPVTIKQFVYTNLTPNQDASRASDNTSDLPTRKNNGTPNDGCIFPQNTKLNKVTQWFWTWKRAVLSCVITLILLAIVVPITCTFHSSIRRIGPPRNSNLIERGVIFTVGATNNRNYTIATDSRTNTSFWDTFWHKHCLQSTSATAKRSLEITSIAMLRWTGL
ncbi:uncharacterized protein LOC112454875 [Temnothorax curvispinosus]|uniref:Uncharacterized protein LOC112454875 n=1 Tax=Temnothorax curvispinosus TaxID=300111 RepID=A0A6J1PSK0_9HYME|nr:uncharacterized protein LOC112454875 [Temnothorax curvispinosus]